MVAFILLFFSFFTLSQCKETRVTVINDNSKIKKIQTRDYQYNMNNVDWLTTHKVFSNSHIHIYNQDFFDYYYDIGVRHFPASNYYPSAPMYPIETYKEKMYYGMQTFGVFKFGEYVPPPIDWNSIVNSWANGLPANTQALLPFVQGQLLVPTLPNDIIFSPNAEHFGFTDGGFHLNSLGSTWASGHFDAADQFEITTNGYNPGTGRNSLDAIDSMIHNLQFECGGGVTINHPTNGGSVSLEKIYSMLDHDPRVLGIEVLNAFFERNTNNGWSEDLWDEILTSGRKCLGFFVYDQYHASYIGTKTGNILLIDKFTEEKALKAYREGLFYGAFETVDFEFMELSESNNIITAKVNKNANFTFISDGVIVKTENNVTTSTYDATNAINNKKKYIRVKVEDTTNNGILFSQPFYIR